MPPSNEFVDLVEGLLKKEPAERLGYSGGYQTVLSHPWFPKGAELTQIENMECPAIITGEEDDEADGDVDFQ